MLKDVESVKIRNALGFIDSSNPLPIKIVEGGDDFIHNIPYYKHIIDTPDANTQYNGYAEPGTLTSAASWLITKQTISGNVITIEFANGSREFNQIFDDRTSLSYP